MRLNRTWRLSHALWLAVAGVLALSSAIVAPAQAVTTNLSELKAQLTEFMRIGFTDDADRTVERIRQIDADEGERWEKIVDYWNNALTDFKITGNADPDSLQGVPDGLPNDRSHVFVVLGHVLNDDGTPKQTLIDRLRVAKAAATKYPNTRIVVTGGQPRSGIREGEVMRDWLEDQGIAADRIIMENQSGDTPNNATMTMDILYGLTGSDSVNSYTLITSATHVRRGAVLYYAASLLEQRDAGADHFVEPLGNATHMDSFTEENYPGSGERDLIAQNVAKVASWDSRGNVEELHLNDNFFRIPLRQLHAKIVYYMSMNKPLDALRAAQEAQEVSITIAKSWPAVITSWAHALEPGELNTTVPAGLPDSGHVFVLLGAGEADRMAGRYTLTKQALDAYPNSKVVLAGNQSEIDNSYTWLTGTGNVASSRIVRSAAGSNAQQGASNAMDAMIGMGNEATTFTLISSGNYIRRPAALYAVAGFIRTAMLRSQHIPQQLGHIVETSVSGSVEAANLTQIAQNATDIIVCQGEYNSYVSAPPATSILSSITLVRTHERVVLIGGELDPSDFQVTATLDNQGSPVEIDITALADLSLPTPTVAGEHRVSASYTYQGVTREDAVTFEVRRADVFDLVTSVDQAKLIDITGYTPQSVAALTAAIEAAQALIGDLDASAADIAAASQALADAIAKLAKPSQPEVVTPTVSIAGTKYSYGSSAQLVAIVTAPNTTVSKGDVVLVDGTRVLSKAKVSSGAARLSLPRDLAVGTYRVTARYVPESGSAFTAATSAKVTITVTALQAKIGKIKAVRGKLRAGKRPRVRIVVKGEVGYRPTGKVVVRVGKKKVGTATLKAKGNRSIAVVRTKKLPKGKVGVRYQGSKIYLATAKKFKKVK